MKAIAFLFLAHTTTLSLPPYQIAGAYWTPPASSAGHVIQGAIVQPERVMFVIDNKDR